MSVLEVIRQFILYMEEKTQQAIRPRQRRWRDRLTLEQRTKVIASIRTSTSYEEASEKIASLMNMDGQ